MDAFYYTVLVDFSD